MVTPFVCFWYFQPNKSWNTCCLCSWMRVLYSMHVGVYLYEIYMYSTTAMWRYSIFIKQVFQSFVLFLTDSVIDRPPPPIPGNQVQTNCIDYLSTSHAVQGILKLPRWVNVRFGASTLYTLKSSDTVTMEMLFSLSLSPWHKLLEYNIVFRVKQSKYWTYQHVSRSK